VTAGNYQIFLFFIHIDRSFHHIFFLVVTCGTVYRFLLMPDDVDDDDHVWWFWCQIFVYLHSLARDCILSQVLGL